MKEILSKALISLNLMAIFEACTKVFAQVKNGHFSIKNAVNFFLVITILYLLHIQASPFYASTSSNPINSLSPMKNLPAFGPAQDSKKTNALTPKLEESIAFIPLKDLRFESAPMTGHTWFMSSLNDTREDNQADHLYLPSKESNGRVLCIRGNNTRDGTKNLYALALPSSLPESAIWLKGVSFVSDTYYDYKNLWHGISAMEPFVGWSLNNQCVKPARWVLFRHGELRDKMGSWIGKVMQASYGDVHVERLEKGDRPYCFEKAVVMRRSLDAMWKEEKVKVAEQLRCKARKFCSIDRDLKSYREVDADHGVPVIRLTLLMRRGPRSFKNPEAVIEVFTKECLKVAGCKLNVVQIDDLSFCDQVRVLTYTDILASPHGAQLTNMLFMDQKSSVMEFFPRGWFELGGVGQYCYHWLAKQSGMIHRGAWWEPIGSNDDCPYPLKDPRCFLFYKGGRVGHNETYFADWASKVINAVKISKSEEVYKLHSTNCSCQ